MRPAPPAHTPPLSLVLGYGPAALLPLLGLLTALLPRQRELVPSR